MINKTFVRLITLPILFWLMGFALSIAGIFYLGLNPKAVNTNFPFYLLAYNLALSVMAMIFLFYTLRRLRLNQKRNIIGSKFTWSFIKIIPLLTLLPVISFYLFSFQYTQQTVEELDTEVGKIVESFNAGLVDQVSKVQDSVNDYVQKIYLDYTNANFSAIDGYIKFQFDEQKRQLQESIKKIDNPDNNKVNQNEIKISLKPILDSLIKQTPACKLQLFNSNNLLIAESIESEKCIQYKDIADEIDKNQPFLYYSYKKEKANFIQTVISTRYFTRIPTPDYLVLSTVFKVSEDSNNALLNLDENFEKFKSVKSFSLKSDKTALRKRFIVDFSTTILLTVLSVLVIVVRMTNKLMTPLHNLSNATREISKGNYDVKIETTSKDDDINLLIKYFNEMSNQIRLSREGLDTHNVYLETILQYSYGVIALDSKKRIQFLNPIVEEMLALDKNKTFVGIPYRDLAKENKNLKILIDLIKQNFNNEKWNSDIKIIFPEQNKLILCQGTKLRAKSKTLGYLIVLNDITELSRAQKKAAWGEVAMKMAHEVKNPLTPILLSADRLRNKFLDSLKGKDLEIMEKTTSTIIEQVKSMSIMVEAFSEFANTPKISKKSQNLNSIINHAIELYDADQEVNISLDLNGSLPDIYLDSESIKRLFINLIKNSKEASTSDLINIKIKSELDQTKNRVKVIIDDDGEGFDSNIIDKIFEPYASTKITGSGLGLAIVHNIVEQHNGNIFAKNIKPHGARIVIELPFGN